ncbi:CotH kinase family protein [Corynebacterium glyciniphilum]|uniref:CotH kinase family protein n=1 Tax=Corynebacterium glyciniphilum TaxID=1404244 RepID=UPI003DA0DE7F
MTQHTNTQRTPLRHRLPVRLRHHWKLLVAAVAVCVAIALVFGASMVRPYITSSLVSETVITNNIEGESDLFDDGDHTIEITVNQAEYDDMISTFQKEGEKDFISADITIDGTLIEDVALRLKGNSTLSSLSGNGMGPGDGREGEDGQMPEAPEGMEMPEGMGGMGGMMTQLSEDALEELPWLISFDEYAEGRAYQGMTEIALRPAASGSDVALNEALALEMTAESGQTTQDYSFSSVSVNGEESASRLVVDTPDAAWADELGDGVLYKARAGGSLDYIGDDPTDYEESFNQLNSEGGYDLQPVMTLMKFLNQSSDEEFGEELDDYIDTESFAEYLAMQEILSNNDAMDGPGNNYYLWYDTTEKKFTILSWDLNMALSGMMGGMGGVGGDTAEGTGDDATQGDEGTTDGMPQMPQNGEMPALPDGAQMPEMPQGGEMPQGRQMPDGGTSDGTGDTGGGQNMPQMPNRGDGEEGGPGGGSDSSILKERFLDNNEFYAMYESAYTELYDQLIASGYATNTLDELTTRAEAAGDTGATALAESIRSTLESLSEDAPEPSTGMGMGGGGVGGPPDAAGDTGVAQDTAQTTET